MIISKKYGIIYRILINMIIKYFSWVKDIVGKSEEVISISPDIDTPEKLINFLITKNEQYKKQFHRLNWKHSINQIKSCIRNYWL